MRKKSLTLIMLAMAYQTDAIYAEYRVATEAAEPALPLHPGVTDRYHEGQKAVPALSATPECVVDLPATPPWRSVFISESALEVSPKLNLLTLSENANLSRPCIEPNVEFSYIGRQQWTPRASIGFSFGFDIGKDDTLAQASTLALQLEQPWGSCRGGTQSSLLGKVSELSDIDEAHGRADHLFGSGHSAWLFIVEPKPVGLLQLGFQCLLPQTQRETHPHHGGIGGLGLYEGSNLTAGLAATGVAISTRLWSFERLAGLVLGGAQYKHRAWRVGTTLSGGKNFLPITYQIETPATAEPTKNSDPEAQTGQSTVILKKSLYAKTSIGFELWAKHARKNQQPSWVPSGSAAFVYQGCFLGTALQDALSLQSTNHFSMPSQKKLHWEFTWNLTQRLSISAGASRDLRDFKLLNPDQETEALARKHAIGGKWPDTTNKSFCSLNPWSGSLKLKLKLIKGTANTLRILNRA